MARAEPRSDRAAAAARAGDRSRNTAELGDADQSAHRRTAKKPLASTSSRTPRLSPPCPISWSRPCRRRRARARRSTTPRGTRRHSRIRICRSGPRQPDRPEPHVVRPVREGRDQRGLVHGQLLAPSAARRRNRSRSTTSTTPRWRTSSSARPTAIHHQPRLQGHRAHHRFQLQPRRRLPPACDRARVGALHGRGGGAGVAQAGSAVSQLGPRHARRAVQQLLQRLQQQQYAADQLHRLELDINAASGATASRTFNIADMSGGCGNAHFYPNTTGTYSYDANTPGSDGALVL